MRLQLIASFAREMVICFVDNATAMATWNAASAVVPAKWSAGSAEGVEKSSVGDAEVPDLISANTEIIWTVGLAVETAPWNAIAVTAMVNWIAGTVMGPGTKSVFRAQARES